MSEFSFNFGDSQQNPRNKQKNEKRLAIHGEQQVLGCIRIPTNVIVYIHVLQSRDSRSSSFHQENVINIQIKLKTFNLKVYPWLFVALKVAIQLPRYSIWSWSASFFFWPMSSMQCKVL